MIIENILKNEKLKCCDVDKQGSTVNDSAVPKLNSVSALSKPKGGDTCLPVRRC